MLWEKKMISIWDVSGKAVVGKNGGLPTEALLRKVKNQEDILSRGRCIGVWSVGRVWGRSMCFSFS